MCSLLPCLCTPSLTVCSLPVPLLLLFLHLPLLSSITASSSSSPIFSHPPFPASFLVCEWWVCGVLVIRHLSRHPSAGKPDEPDRQPGRQNDKSRPERGGETDSPAATAARLTGRRRGNKKKKNVTGRETSREAALRHPGE